MPIPVSKLCVGPRLADFGETHYTNAAKFDSEHVAGGYSGGIPTDSPPSHFQSAWATDG